MENINKLIVGSYCNEDEAGMGVYDFRLSDGSMACRGKVRGLKNPSYLTKTEDGKNMYAVIEVPAFREERGGAAASFSIEDGKLQLLNMVGTKGEDPCYILVDDEKKYLYTANYTGGSVSMFELEEDGSIARLCDIRYHAGSGPNKERQEAPHVHCLGFSKDKEGLWCADLGLDAIKYYRIDKENGLLFPEENRDIMLPKGTGPRHFVMDRNRSNRMFVICELTSEIMAIRIEQFGGTVLQRISTLQEPAPGNTCAALKLSEDGNFLYASNRGNDSISVYSIGIEDRRLQLLETVKTNGQAPRDFLLWDKYLVAANQKSDSLTVFIRDLETGCLTGTGKEISCQSPVCIIQV